MTKTDNIFLVVFVVADDSNWLGLDASPSSKQADTEDWIKQAKSRRASQQKEASIFGDPAPVKPSSSFRSVRELIFEGKNLELL